MVLEGMKEDNHEVLYHKVNWEDHKVNKANMASNGLNIH